MFQQLNRCADALARIGADQVLEFRSFESSLVDVFDLVEQDKSVLYFNRLCLVPG